MSPAQDLRAASYAPGAVHQAQPKSHATRVLHLFMLLVVLHQLFGSLIIARPRPGEAPGWPYWMHEYVGIVGVGAITLFWLWTLLRNSRETGLVRLFPWFSAKGWSGLVADLRSLFDDLAALRMPSLHLDNLASAVHGLGLLAATVMAGTGASWYFLAHDSVIRRPMMTTHHMVANLMWAYVIAHVSLAVIHRLLGDDVFARMFWARGRA